MHVYVIGYTKDYYIMFAEKSKSLYIKRKMCVDVVTSRGHVKFLF